MNRRYAVASAIAFVAAAVVALPGVAFADETVTAHLTSSNPTVGQQLTIEGDVTGASMAQSSVTMSRTDSTGTTPMVDTTTTDDKGHFALHDTPPARGSVTYHVTADAGAASADVTTTVAGRPTDLVIHVSPSPATAEQPVQVTAQLRSTTTNRDVTLYFRPYQGSRQQFDQGPVDANGNRTADHVVHRRTTFIVAFAGDSAYAPATAQATIRVGPVLDEQLKGWYGSSGGARLYHRKHNPSLAVHMLPEHKGNCLYFRAQHRSHGKWVRSAVSSCVKTDATGRAIGVLTGNHIAGVAYRLRAEWHGTKAIARRNGAWMHLEFR